TPVPGCHRVPAGADVYAGGPGRGDTTSGGDPGAAAGVCPSVATPMSAPNGRMARCPPWVWTISTMKRHIRHARHVARPRTKQNWKGTGCACSTDEHHAAAWHRRAIRPHDA